MAVMQLVIGSIVLLFYSFYFAVIVFAILAISAFIVYILGHHAAKYAIAESYAKYDMVAWLQTIAKNFHIFKFSHGHQLAKNKTEQPPVNKEIVAKKPVNIQTHQSGFYAGLIFAADLSTVRLQRTDRKSVV